MNGQSNRDVLLEEIQTGEYTHGKDHYLLRFQPYIKDKLTTLVLLSPEIALSERFKMKVLYDQAFQDHLVLVAIDELHVVSDWGQHWRTSYSQLALLQDLIGKTVPWLGCSVTLDPVTLVSVQDLSRFNPSVCIQHVSINRPDITFAI